MEKLIAQKGNYRVIRNNFRSDELYFLQRIEGSGYEGKVFIKAFRYRLDALEFLELITSRCTG